MATKSPSPQVRVTDNHNLNIRKIENGYVVNESWNDPKKGWQSKETFSECMPHVELKAPSKVKRQAKPKSTLAKSIRAMK